ncbi:MAG: hypothetical protein ACOC8O_00670 [Natronomonas sp.]
MAIPTPTNQYLIDEESGTTVGDSEGSVDGTIDDGSWTEDTEHGWGIEWDGSGDQGVDFGDNLPNQTTFTLYVAFYPHQTADFANVFSKGLSHGGNSGDSEWWISVYNDSLYANVQGDGALRGDTIGGLTADDLHRVAMCVDWDGNMWIYHNGTETYDSDISADSPANTTSFNATMGVDSWRDDFQFDGVVYEAAYWDQQLSKTDAEDLTNNGLAGEPFFDVTITGTNEPVSDGETLEVYADVENTGGAEGTQEIELNIDPQ